MDEEFDRMMHASRSSNMPITSVWKAPLPTDLWANAAGGMGTSGNDLMMAAPPMTAGMAGAQQQHYIGVIPNDEMGGRLF